MPSATGSSEPSDNAAAEGAMTGGCLCGAVRYRLDGPLGPVVQCHCLQCRKAQGGAFALVTPVRAEHFVLLAGADALRGYESSPGKWRISYEEWEYCRILSGRSVITDETTGEAHEVRAGDSFILRPGFRGTWEVIETTRKDYVIRL